MDRDKARPSFDDWAINDEAELALAFDARNCEELGLLLTKRVALPVVIDEIDDVSITLLVGEDFGKTLWFPFRAHALWDALCDMAEEAYAWETWDRIQQQVWEIEGFEVTVEHPDRHAWKDPSYAEKSFDFAEPAPDEWTVDDWYWNRITGPLSGFRVAVQTPPEGKASGRQSLEAVRRQWLRVRKRS